MTQRPDDGDAVFDLSAQHAEIRILEAPAAGLPPGIVLRFRGIALIDNAISQNDRLYTEAFNSSCLEETQKFMKMGGTVSMYSRHGRAVQPGALATGLPVGHVTLLGRAGPRVVYESHIVDTSEGRDVAVLLRTGAMRATSIRLRQGFKSRKVSLKGRVLEELTYGIIKGIDLADEAGIVGAGVEQILEEAPDVQVLDPKGENDMTDWEKVTLKDLQDNCAAILTDYAASVLEANKPAAVTDDPDAVAATTATATAAAALTAVTAERDKAAVDLKTAQDAVASQQAVLEALQGEVTPLKLEKALLEASQIGVGQAIYASLKEKCKTLEEIPGALEGVRTTALNAFILEANPKAKPISQKGNASTGDDDEVSVKDPPAGITEELQGDILRLATH